MTWHESDLRTAMRVGVSIIINDPIPFQGSIWNENENAVSTVEVVNNLELPLRDCVLALRATEKAYVMRGWIFRDTFSFSSLEPGETRSFPFLIHSTDYGNADLIANFSAEIVPYVVKDPVSKTVTITPLQD